MGIINSERRMVMKKTILVLVAILLFLPLLAAGYEYNGPESELISLINNERELAGVPPLVIDWEVARLARYKSEDMKSHKMFDHESLVYGNPAQLLERFHISFSQVGANIAMGHEVPREVMEAWVGSDGHLANLLNVDFTRAGVGLSRDEDGILYWALLLVAE